MKRFPLITAHSGCMGMPDNTLLSAETGLRLGADVVEDDIRTTRDGVPVLSHDDTIRLAEGTECRISQMTYAELRELDVELHRERQTEIVRIAALESMLSLVKTMGKTANLDLKTDESIESVSALVRKLDMQEQVFLTGCEAARALEVQRISPNLRKALNANSMLFLQVDYPEAVKRTLEDAREANCFGINIDYRFVRPELLEAAKQDELPVLVWTVQEEAAMRRFADMGVLSITTRNVSALVRLKQEWTSIH
jgi:glycerophosphoryl diester phosphodiesterase